MEGRITRTICHDEKLPEEVRKYTGLSKRWTR